MQIIFIFLNQNQKIVRLTDSNFPTLGQHNILFCASYLFDYTVCTLAMSQLGRKSRRIAMFISHIFIKFTQKWMNKDFCLTNPIKQSIIKYRRLIILTLFTQKCLYFKNQNSIHLLLGL